MRYRMFAALVAACALSVPASSVRGDTAVPKGQDPDRPAQVQNTPAPDPAQGVLEETPNQRRRRLGLPIPSYAPPDYGEKLETPNQRRRRLALASAKPA